MRVFLFALLATAALLLAGCAQTKSGSPLSTNGSGALVVGKDLATGPGGGAPLKAGPALWLDPQNTPHPKWDWPTLSNPPVGDNVPAWWHPIQGKQLPAHITGMKHEVQVGGNVTAGAGIALFGSLAVVPEDATAAHFVDISDPLHPSQVGQIDTRGRGAAIIAYPNGRLVTAISTSPGFDVIDITDPAHPVMLNQTKPSEGGHKLGVVPGTPILYNAASNGGANVVPTLNNLPCDGVAAQLCQAKGYTSIYNLTDPEHPKLVEEFQNGYSCHHIFFWNAPDGSKQRAVCAGMEVTQLWDTKDPEHPKVIVNIPMQLGNKNLPSTAETTSIVSFSHSAGMNIKGDVLYVGDESFGGGMQPGCGASTSSPEGNAGTPIGATWFYDISDESNPSVLGYFSPTVQQDTYYTGLNPQQKHSDSCTTHHGRLVPDKEGRDLLAMSYYGDGVILIDFTGIKAGTLPKQVDQFASESNTWETWYDNGYLFTGDLSRGMDVLSLR